MGENIPSLHERERATEDGERLSCRYYALYDIIDAIINVIQVRERDQQQGSNNERYTQSGKLRRKYARKEVVNTTTTSGGVVSTSQAVMSTQGANVSCDSSTNSTSHQPTNHQHVLY